MKTAEFFASIATVAVCLLDPSVTRAQIVADGTSVDATDANEILTGNNLIVFHALNNGEITGTNPVGDVTAIDLNSSSTIGMNAETGGTITFTGANIAAAGPFFPTAALATGSGSVITLNGGTLATSGGGARGLLASSGATIESSAAITATGPNSIGVWAEGSGSAITLSAGSVDVVGDSAFGSVGLYARNGGSITSSADIEVTGGTDIFNDQVSRAVLAEGSGSTITLDGGSVTTNDFFVTALRADSGGMIESSADISTTGSAANGVVATGSGSTVILTGGGVTTGGSSAAGILASAGGTIESSVDITTSGDNANGAEAQSGGTITLTVGSVSTEGDEAHGLVVRFGNGAITSSVDITTSGDNAWGAYADGSGSTITLNGGIITTGGEDSHGLHAEDGGSITGAVAVDITTTGEASLGAIALGVGSIIDLTGGSITTSGGTSFGLAANSGGVITSSASVSTSGNGARGAFAIGEGSNITLNGGSISTSGGSAHGLEAAGGGTITSSVNVTTTGAESFGAASFGPDSFIGITGGDIATSGFAAAGLLANGGGEIEITGGSVTTEGNDARGLYALTNGAITSSAGVVTSGAGAHAAAARDGGRLAIGGALLQATGEAAAGVAFTARDTRAAAATPGEATAFADLAGTTIETADGPSLFADVEASGETTLDAVTSVVNNGFWLQALANSSLDVIASGSQLRGAASSENSASTSVTLQNATRWDLTDHSVLTSLTVRDSLIQFSGGGTYKTLTVNRFSGDNGIIGLNTFLGGDGSESDRLVIDGGAATGKTLLRIQNSGAPGGPTSSEGIKVVDTINGGTTTPGAFALDPDQPGAYEIGGRTALAAGAYGYTLYRGHFSEEDETVVINQKAKNKSTKVATAKAHGSDPYGDREFSNDWYLRNVLVAVAIPQVPTVPVSPSPLYSPATPIYEAYPSILLSQLRLPTLQQRVGTRYWRDGAESTLDPKNPLAAVGKAPRFSDKPPLSAKNAPPITDRYALIEGTAAWGRLTGSLASFDDRGSTTGAEMDTEQWQFQFGVDGLLHEGERGRWIVGLNGHYGRSDADIGSFFGKGRIDAEGYGLGASVTWYGDGGFYLDTQAQVTWFESELLSHTLHSGLASNNDAFGWATGLEMGKRLEIASDLHLVPHMQVINSDIHFDNFTDPFGARVSLNEADQWIGRAGLALESQKAWTAADGTTSRRSLYGILNACHRFDEGTKVDVNGVKLVRDGASTWGGVGVGLSRNWRDDRYSIYGEVEADTDLEHFGDSWQVEGNIGIRVAF